MKMAILSLLLILYIDERCVYKAELSVGRDGGSEVGERG